jgi:predicted RNA-binding Zn-ribbon protein involved in translation (DUF1610 family)
MVRKVKVTRHGMTSCPSCHAHIRVAKTFADTVCPFCQTAFVEAAVTGSRVSGLSRVTQAGKSSVLAASLLGLSGLTGCSTEPNDASADASSQDGIVLDAGMDVIGQPLYGAPADISAPDVPFDAAEDASPSDVSADVEDSFSVQPAYGLPADIVQPDTGEDTAEDIEHDTAADVGPQPVYGLPADAN